jgi:hypothetical protein
VQKLCKCPLCLLPTSRVTGDVNSTSLLRLALPDKFPAGHFWSIKSRMCAARPLVVFMNLVSVAETPNQNRDRSAYIAQYLRTQKPRRIDTRPNHCHRLRSDSFQCICAFHPCAGTSHWLAECYSQVLDTGCKT